MVQMTVLGACGTSGGPGATAVLEISGMTFNEIVLDGQVEF